MELAGKRAIVTGGADGLGRCVVEALARAGARVLILDVDRAKADELAAALRREGAEAHVCGGSVAESAEVDAAFASADAALGGLDILVNNAGVTGNRPALEITDAFWDRILDINLRGTFLCARAAGRRMVAQGGGVILNIASMYGVVAAPERLAYCVSKSGVAMMTKVLAVEWGAAGVRVNALAPGYIQTPGTEELVALGRLDLARIRGRTPLGRLATPQEVAELALFVCSPAAGFVSGQVIGVDGGWSAYGYI